MHTNHWKEIIFARFQFILLLIVVCVGSNAAAQSIPPMPVDPPETKESLARKMRSVTQLRAEGIPVLDSLPVIEDTASTNRRTTEEIVHRTIALTIVAVKGETGDYDLGQKLIEQFSAQGFFSPDENDYMNDANATRQAHINAAWRYEDVHVLLWALGIFDTLGPPNDVCDVPLIAETLRKLGAEGLLENARLRSQSELLDAADLIYRYHWATTDARINDRPSPGDLDSGVVFERHYVLNWLIGYQAAAWDDVATDT